MDRDSNFYTFLFVGVMIVGIASILAYTSQTLKPMQDENVKNEKMQNILSTVGINVKINTYWYQKKNKFPREQIFKPNFFGLKEAGNGTLKAYELLDKYAQKKYYFKNDNNIFVSYHFYIGKTFS